MCLRGALEVPQRCSSALRVDLSFRGASQESRTCELPIGAIQVLQMRVIGLISALEVPQGCHRGALEVP